jgi:hypothetical protein
MAIPNVNEITSQLRMMSDQQLQQYAAMHKADPYILPMAVSESNARKQMRSEQQALSMGQQQPKVADADIAAMAPPPQMPQQMPAQQQLPEHQGIGALPAQNMQHMADGGIAGYAGGGMDEQLAYSNEPVMRMAGGGIAHFADKGAVRGPYNDDTTSYDPFTGVPVTGDYTTSGNDDRTMLERLGIFNPENRRANERAEAAARARAAGTPAPTGTPYNEATATRAADYATEKTGAVGGPKMPPTTRPAGGPSAAPAAPAPSYMDQAKTLYDKTRPQVEGLEALAAQRKATMEKMGVTGEAGEAQKQAYEKEAEQAADDKKEMLYMAMIKGGLAAAAGTSQHAIKNIAEGFGIGVDDAAKGLKELKQAEKERSKGLAAIEEARRAEKRGDTKDAMAAVEKQKEHQANYDMHYMQSQATLLGHQIGAGATVEAAKIHKEAALATAGAGQRAQLEMFEKLGAAAPGSNLRKGFELSKQEGQEPRMYAEYVKMANDPMKGEEFMRKYPTFDVFMAGKGGGGAGQIYSGNAIPAGAVRPRGN